MKCKNCKEKTTNPKFCSKSCAATYNNKKFPKRKPESICKDCGKPNTKSRTYCQECWDNRQFDKMILEMSSKTLKEIQNARKYQKNSRIRTWSRKIYIRSGRPQMCENCGYDKHFEVCHIKAINSFPETATVGEINSLDNLKALCPNCHWEFDHGLK